MSRNRTSLLIGLLCVALTGAALAQEAQVPQGVEGAELLPPNAKPGECYTRVFVPPVYRTETEQVLVRDASERVEIVPARYEWVEEKVLVKEASTKLEVVPATYGWVEEKVLVKPASKRIEEVPARYETMTEKVLDRPAHTVWKKGEGPIQRVDNSTGEIMCLVEVPATYKTVTKTVLKSPATTREVEIPAKYETVKKRVLKTPPTTREIQIPAEYDTVKVRKEVSPSRVQRTPIPAEYRNVSTTAKVNDGRMAWTEVLCRTNASTDLISRIQRALSAAGHNPGPIDGVLGQETYGAIRSYQAARSLPQGGLTLETIESLGVRI